MNPVFRKLMERKKSQPPRLTSTPRPFRSSLNVQDSFYDMSPILAISPTPRRCFRSLIPVKTESNILEKAKLSLPNSATNLRKISVG